MEKFKINILCSLVFALFKSLSYVVKFKPVNVPEIDQFIIALWHAHQCVLYGVKNKHLLNVLISKSNDGEIVARAAEGLGIKTIRGSYGRKGAEATLKLIEKLEQGENIAITVDGPKGPARVVKKGIVNIAKISQVPIIPLVWHSASKCFLKFSSWDSFRFPMGAMQTVALYGDPIYVPSDCDEDGIEFYRKKVEDEMHRIEKNLLENYDEYLKS